MAAALVYLLSVVLFINGLKKLTQVRTARTGNHLSALAMGLAVLGTLLELGHIDYRWLIAGLLIGSAIGLVAAYKVSMNAMPGMVGLLNGSGGAASALVALATIWLKSIEPRLTTSLADLLGPANALTAGLSILLGGLTTSGSYVAYLKVQEKVSDRPTLLPGRHLIMALLLGVSLLITAALAYQTLTPLAAGLLCLLLVLLSLAVGVLAVIPIGGADMPVIIALLNACSGLAAAATGFLIGNMLLITCGALVGASGVFLTYLMCTAMNRTFIGVLVGGFGAKVPAANQGEYRDVRAASVEEAAIVLENARSLIVVPGYGLAVAQAQHAVRELAELLQRRGAKVSYAIHPVAGRMPGHMNVLLAEANVPYDQLIEMDGSNAEFPNTDAVLVIGANDVVNPAAENDQTSPLWGMPILKTYKAGSVFVVKRSLGSGFAGVKNELFEQPNCRMIFGDAKKIVQELIAEVKQAG